MYQFPRQTQPLSDADRGDVESDEKSVSPSLLNSGSAKG